MIRCDGWHWSDEKRPIAIYKDRVNLFWVCAKCKARVDNGEKLSMCDVNYSWELISFKEQFFAALARPLELAAHYLFRMGVRTKTDWFSLWAYRVHRMGMKK